MPGNVTFCLQNSLIKKYPCLKSIYCPWNTGKAMLPFFISLGRSECSYCLWVNPNILDTYSCGCRWQWHCCSSSSTAWGCLTQRCQQQKLCYRIWEPGELENFSSASIQDKPERCLAQSMLCKPQKFMQKQLSPGLLSISSKSSLFQGEEHSCGV